MFQWGVCFSDGGASFLSGGRHRFWWGEGVLKKNCKMGRGSTPNASPTKGNPDNESTILFVTFKAIDFTERLPMLYCLMCISPCLIYIYK